LKEDGRDKGIDDFKRKYQRKEESPSGRPNDDIIFCISSSKKLMKICI